MGRLEDRVALVTGGANGIGEGIVERFIEEGAKVTVVDLDTSGLDAMTERLPASNVRCLRGDHCSAEDNKAALDSTVAAWGGLDILVHNASSSWVGPFVDHDNARMERIVESGLYGPWRLTQQALPLLKASAAKSSDTGAAIIFTASGAGIRGIPMMSAYGMMKHGVVGLMRSLAKELGQKNIRVNAVCPGPVETKMMLAAWQGQLDRDAVVTKFLAEQPIQRMATPRDIAHGFVFLASDEARMVNGHALTVDGGRHGY